MMHDDRLFMEFNDKYINENWNPKEDFRPIVMSQGRGGIGLMPVAELMQGVPEKKLLNEVIRVFAKKAFADRVALISESWMVSYEARMGKADKAIDEAFDKHGAIRNMPNRIEVIMLSVWTRELNILKLYHIDRKTGTLIPQEEMETSITQVEATNFKNPFIPHPSNN